MPPWQYWFQGSALTTFFGILGLFVSMMTLGVTWHSTAVGEQKKAETLAATDAEKARLATIRQHLQEFYVRGGILLNRPLAKNGPEQEFSQYVQDFTAWASETETWIAQNLGTAAAARFADVGGGFSFTWNRAINEQHNNLINILTKGRENLAKLIESNAWDANERK